MNRRLGTPILLLGLVAAANFTQAQEWTRFRGPNGQGQCDAAAIPTEWTESDYNWRVELPGIGHSSPVIWGDRVFVTSGDSKSGARHIICLNAADGEILWHRDFPSTTHRVHNQNSFNSSTPALDSQRVYAAWATPEEIILVALTHDGKDAWKLNLGPYKSQHGFGTSPIVVDDLVILTNDQDAAENCSLVAVDASTGRIHWQIPRRHTGGRQNASYSTPCMLEGQDGRQLIVHSWAHGVSGYDPQTGAVNWEYPAFPLRPVSSPVLVAGLIVGSCGEGSGNNSVVAIRPGGKDGRAASVAYTLDKSSAPYVPTMCAAGDLLFLWGDRGVVTCIDAAEGTVHWRERVGGNFYGSPVRVGERIYCIADDGEVVVLAASKEFKVLARNPLGEGSHSTPAVADGRMYLRTQSHLISIGGQEALSHDEDTEARRIQESKEARNIGIQEE